MAKCEQMKGQTVLQHGQSVRDYAFDLISSLNNDKIDNDWNVPGCIWEYRENILLNLHSFYTIREYTTYHDCGKPFCKFTDDDGGAHFPDHADVSKRVYSRFNKNEVVANLIGWDMVLHTSSSEEIDRYLKEEWSIRDAMTLVLVSLAEVHSNARMFGGIGTNSFKSKLKKIKRRANQICKYYFVEDCLRE